MEFTDHIIDFISFLLIEFLNLNDQLLAAASFTSSDLKRQLEVK